MISANQSPFFAVQGVSVYFRGIAALRNVRTAMAAGESRGLIGPNGAGKISLLNIINRFYTLSRGTAWLNGMPHPQSRESSPTLTVLENLHMGAYRRRKPVAIQYARYLSGGEQQILTIGRGLMMQPTLLLLDEPSASLAPLVADNIFRTLAAMQTDGFPLLIVEQMCMPHWLSRTMSMSCATGLSLHRACQRLCNRASFCTRPIWDAETGMVGSGRTLR